MVRVGEKGEKGVYAARVGGAVVGSGRGRTRLGLGGTGVCDGLQSDVGLILEC